MISVIIPVYNAEMFLRKCLDSVCAQTYSDLEILAVNDGSTDGSAQILAQYAEADPRVHIISQPNLGISKARNAGIDRANGEWIAFVDSDDWIDPETLEQAMLSAEQDQVDIVMWSYVREYSTGPKPVEVFGRERRTFTADPLLIPYRRMVGPVGEELAEPQKFNSCITVWGKLYRKNVIGNHRMVDTDRVCSEDTLFNVEVFSDARSVTYLPEQYYHYQKSGADSFTKRDQKVIFDQFSTLYMMIRAHIGQDPVLMESLQNRISLGVINLGRRIVRNRGIGFSERYRRLRSLLNREEYRQAISRLQFRFFPLHWRFFFFCARYRLTVCLYLLRRSMDYLSRRG